MTKTDPLSLDLTKFHKELEDETERSVTVNINKQETDTVGTGQREYRLSAVSIKDKAERLVQLAKTQHDEVERQRDNYVKDFNHQRVAIQNEAETAVRNLRRDYQQKLDALDETAAEKLHEFNNLLALYSRITK